MRDQVQAQKDNWLKFAGGNRSTLETYVSQAESLYRTAQQQPNRDIAQLVQALGAVGAHLRKTQSGASEMQSIEVATAFLFLESSLENYFRLTIDFAAQSATIVSRLKGAMTGAELPAIEAGANALMDDMTKRAQERMLMFQVGQEVQVNLTTIENALDGFFRDSQKTGELSSLPPLFSQVQGALTILELDEAAALNQLLRERVTQFASGAIKGAGDDAEAVAEGVSALGLYITALQQGTANPRNVLLPALIRFGLAERPADPEKTTVKSPVSESDVDVAKQKVQERYEEWKLQPEQTASRDQLREAVEELKVEARLIADSKSVKQSDEALKAIEASFDPTRTGITEALSEIAPEKPTEAPAAQMVQLIDAPAAEVDQELLEIFPRRGCRGSRHHSRASRRRQSGADRQRGNDHHSPRLPHAQGQRPHGRLERPGRSRMELRTGHEQVAQGREAREPRLDRLYRSRLAGIPQLGRGIAGQWHHRYRRCRVGRDCRAVEERQRAGLWGAGGERCRGRIVSARFVTAGGDCSSRIDDRRTGGICRTAATVASDGGCARVAATPAHDGQCGDVFDELPSLVDVEPASTLIADVPPIEAAAFDVVAEPPPLEFAVEEADFGRRRASVGRSRRFDRR